MNKDENYMYLAIAEAKKANNLVMSNPYVGCVIIKNDLVIAKGYHQYFGCNHAEINALQNATEAVSGATMYVTLEPCFHIGKTAACVEKIIKANIKRVVIGMKDPNPMVSGKSIEKLRATGIDVEVEVLRFECEQLNVDFKKYITTGVPYITMKSAISLDGKIATINGDSRGMSSNQAWKYTQKLRNRHQVIMVGVNTVIADNPKLTCRVPGYNSPIRIIVDSKFRTPINSRLVQTAKDTPTIIVTTIKDERIHAKFNALGVETVVIKGKGQRVDIDEMLKVLGEMEVKSILLEPGSKLAASFISQKLIDELIVYICPKIIGGDGLSLTSSIGCDLVSAGIELQPYTTKQAGCDVILKTKLKEV